MRHFWFLFQQECHNLINVQIIIAQGDVDFIQQNKLNAWIKDQRLGLFPTRLCRCDITCLVLCVPCEPFA